MYARARPLQPALALLEGVVRAVHGDNVIVVPIGGVMGEAVAAHVDASVGVIVIRTRDIITVPAALLKLEVWVSLFCHQDRMISHHW